MHGTFEKGEKLGTVSCVCFGTYKNLGEVRASWCQGRDRAWYLPTAPAMGRELHTTGTDYRDNLINNGFNTQAKGGAGTAAERNSLTSSSS